MSTHNLKEIDDHNNGLKIVNALLVTYEPDRMVEKASDASAADKQCQTRQKLS